MSVIMCSLSLVSGNRRLTVAYPGVSTRCLSIPFDTFLLFSLSTSASPTLMQRSVMVSFMARHIFALKIGRYRDHLVIVYSNLEDCNAC